MIMKGRLWLWLMACAMLLGLDGCNEWLGEEEFEQEISFLTRDVDFVATSVNAKKYSGIYANYKSSENFFFQFLGDERENGVRDVMHLDLIAPAGTVDPVGTYTVGYSGDYVALSRYDVVDQTSGMFYTGGSYYGEARGGYMSDYYGFLTEGKVVISRTAEGIYTVEVDAKSALPTVKMTYAGAITFKQDDKEEPKPAEQ